MKFHSKLILVISFCYLSCQNDINNIAITGIISNKKTGNPIGNTEISFICWFYGKSVAQGYTGKEIKIVVTNEKGKYNVNFDKASFVEIKLVKNGFSKIHEAIYI